ncbi:MAG TPA: high-affinity branched-chain amino acid ABC transporter ATP-binding protein LivG, partial [Spirochaetaceae bacterium]|nr:high-affinity branched-chain amino acid ABC transporter ATP-binding protein LivG [Spirochaetaceae bacterium]
MIKLRTTNLTKRFMGLVAVNNVSFSMEEGEILGIIGPNGAGKTTFINLISGIIMPS